MNTNTMNDTLYVQITRHDGLKITLHTIAYHDCNRAFNAFAEACTEAFNDFDIVDVELQGLKHDTYRKLSFEDRLSMWEG